MDFPSITLQIIFWTVIYFTRPVEKLYLLFDNRTIASANIPLVRMWICSFPRPFQSNKYLTCFTMVASVSTSVSEWEWKSLRYCVGLHSKWTIVWGVFVLTDQDVNAPFSKINKTREKIKHFLFLDNFDRLLYLYYGCVANVCVFFL